MRLLAIKVSKAMVVFAIAFTEVAVIVLQPESWEIAALALTAMLLACWSLSEPGRTTKRMTSPRWAGRWKLRFHRVRFTVRGTMAAVACVAVLLWPAHHWLQKPYYDEMASFHGMMAGLCESEAVLMKHRAKACSVRAQTGASWDDPSEEAETLKCCPYPEDVPRYGSWSEQAAIWERAARGGKRAAKRHARLCDYWHGWSPVAPRGL